MLYTVKVRLHSYFTENHISRDPEEVRSDLNWRVIVALLWYGCSVIMYAVYVLV